MPGMINSTSTSVANPISPAALSCHCWSEPSRVVNKVKHIDPVASLTNPLDSADSLLKPRRIPRQVYINECPERLKIQTFAGGIRGRYKAGIWVWGSFLGGRKDSS